METAAELGAFSRPLWRTAAASEGSSLKDRLLCILDPAIRRGGTSRLVSAAVVLMISAVVVPISAMSIWTQSLDGANGIGMPYPVPADSRAQPTSSAKETVPASPPEAMPGDQRQVAEASSRRPAEEEIRPAQRAGRRLARLAMDLESPDQQVRITAVVGLRSIRDPGVVPLLRKALGDSYDEVRIAAVLGLGALQGKEATQGLREALEDEVLRIKVAAVTELGKRRSPEAYEALLEASRDESWIVRDAARSFLDQLDGAGVPR
jgi:hypothetical protein